VPLPEKRLIAEIRRLARTGQRPATGPATGIGDDCAILRPAPGQDLLVTTDFSLEGIHFRRDWHPPQSVGHRCLARGLSDIAAMGGEPIAAFLSLALPPDLRQAWARRFLQGLVSLAHKHKTPLAGGDTAQSPSGILADIIVIGSVPKGKAILRSGARPGDRIYVSGELGGSAAALIELTDQYSRRRHRERSRSSGGAKDLPPAGPSLAAKAANRKALDPRNYPRHFYPQPRLELGRMLREKKLAAAMIDLSDGLSTDLAHICEESNVGADIAAVLIPKARVGKPVREVSLDLALNGGEDYELLFTAPSGTRMPTRILGIPLTCIGRITRSNRILLRNEKGIAHELPPQGWEHFQRINK
jgi:thiamine-monophosphate kinase